MMRLSNELDDFLHYLQIERGLAENTITSYHRDLNQYTEHLSKKRKVVEWKIVSRKDILSFLHQLMEDRKSSATISLVISSIRSFHQFLFREQITDNDPSLHIQTPRRDRSLPDILTTNEIDKLLTLKSNSPLDIRNKAMLELAYGAGLRV